MLSLTVCDERSLYQCHWQSAWLFAVPRLLYKTRNGAYTSHHHFTTFENHVRVHHRQHQSRISCLQVSGTPEIGEELSTVWETSNTHDRFAVAIRKGTLTIGHVPAEISKVCCFFFFFLRRGGTIKCRVSTDRHHLSLLEQSGLKVACELIFVADDQKLLKKLKKDCIYTHTLTIIILFALVF